MNTFKNIFFMGASTTVRLVSGMLAFSVMARMLGPEPFGVVMFWLSVATLVTLVANYGFTPYVLREIGVNPETAEVVMSEVLSAKVLVAVALVVATVCAAPFVATKTRWIFVLLMFTQLVDSTTDFLNVGYRATNRFGVETRVATVASVIQLFIVAGLVWWLRNATIAAAALFVSRLSVLFMTWSSQARYFSNLRPAPVSRAVFRLRHAVSYAMDFGLQSLFGQVDSVVLNHFLGPIAVGLHQAGMRLFLGGAQSANVLANVFIPRVAASVECPEGMQREGQRLQTAFIASGAIFGLLLAIASEQIVRILFGQQFMALSSLLPWFGILFFVRFFAASSGVLLTSAGRQGLRAKANVFHWLLIFAAAWILVPLLGNLGWLIALVIGNLVLGIVYFLCSIDLVRPSRGYALVTAAGAGAFLPFLHLP